MTKEGYAKLTLVLSLVAAALALSAALIKYVRRGEVNVGLMAAGYFCWPSALVRRAVSHGEVVSAGTHLTTACSGRASSNPLIINHSCAPLMPSVRRLSLA